MEEQPVTVQTEPAIVASNTKHSWSKKERIALSIAGVFALVGIGFGGFTFYNQVILNAAGEESLGSDVSVDLPPANESPYFKILRVAQQDIVIQPLGEAADCTADMSRCGFKQDWVLEQSNNPTEQNTWKIVHGQTEESNAAQARCGWRGVNGSMSKDNPMLPLLSTSILRLDHSNGEVCPELKQGPLKLTNSLLMQPGTNYYFRVSKMVRNDDGASTLMQYGNVVSATTTLYPQMTFSQDNNQLKFSWTASQGGNESSVYHYGIARSTSASDFTNASVIDWRGDDTQQVNDHTLYTLSQNDIVDSAFQAGQKTITQRANTTYYYAMVIYESTFFDDTTRTDQGMNSSIILRVLGPPVVAITNATVAKSPIVNLTVKPTSVPANKVESVVVSGSLTDTCDVVKPQTCLWNINNTMSVKRVNGTTASIGSFEDPQRTNNNKDLSINALSSLTSDQTAPGTYTLKSTITFGNAVQTVETPVTLTKVTPNLSASYKAATVKYKSDVVITIKNAYLENYSLLPTGKIIVKNLNNKKTLKEITLSANQTSKTITLKGVKKGTYNLAVAFTADAKKGIFEDKTINLPQLIVK